MLSNSAKLDKSKLRFDGYYNPYDTTRGYIGNAPIGERITDMYYLTNFFSFYKNGLCLAKMGSYRDGAEVNSLCIYNRFTEEQNKGYSEWGAYKITDDTLEILCYRHFSKRGDLLKSYLTHYRGILKGRDSIVDFKMMPPYPHVNAKINDNFAYEIGPQVLIFKRNPCKAYIDSDAVWLNKYRQ